MYLNWLKRTLNAQTFRSKTAGYGESGPNGACKANNQQLSARRMVKSNWSRKGNYLLECKFASWYSLSLWKLLIAYLSPFSFGEA